jgi:hypothetical protein
MQTFPSPVVFRDRVVCTYTVHFDPEDGGSVYLQNVGKIGHINKV